MIKTEIHPYTFGYVVITFDNNLNTVYKITFSAEPSEDEIKPSIFIQKVLDVLNNNSQKVDDIQFVYLHGSPFQKKVWDALRTIPYGETRTYQQIADQINMPKAVRAVANACGQNPVAILIPCHRVILSSGKLGGYAWGPELKAKLLEREK